MSNLKSKKQVYEGKGKILFEGPEPGTLIQYFKDDATAFNNKKHDVFLGKGVLNNRISEYIMNKLNDIGVPTHFIRTINMREQLVKAAEIIPVEFVVRNVVAGSLVTRLGLEEGTLLSRPIIEYYYKNDALGDPMITEEHFAILNIIDAYELEEIRFLAIRINDFMSGLFAAVGIKLVDFKIEFGRHFDGESQELLLADEISPDSCRLWDIKTNEKLDKDVFRRDIGNITEAYLKVAQRLGIYVDKEILPDSKTNK